MAKDRAARVEEIAAELVAGMRGHTQHTQEHIDAALAMWHAWADCVHPRYIKKPKSHAAAAHYAFAKAMGLGMTQREIARIHRVPKSRITRFYKVIWDDLDLDAGLGSLLERAPDPAARVASDDLMRVEEIHVALAQLLARGRTRDLVTLWRTHAAECAELLDLERLDHLAAALVEREPEVAAEIYAHLAMAHIDRGTRKHYEGAASMLERHGEALQRAGMTLGHQDLVRAIWQDAHARPVLREVLAARGVLEEVV
ncbi:MAG: hypothetical protein AAGI01_07470 [Myxococcota bacterium]